MSCLHKVFGHLSSLPYLFLNLNKGNLLHSVVSKEGWQTNSVDPDETADSVAASPLGLRCLLRPVCLNTHAQTVSQKGRNMNKSSVITN